MSDAQLDTLVPRDDSPADWDDVLRRARGRRPPRLVLAAAAVAAAALVVGPALGVLLTRHTTPRLPAGADRKNVVVILQPLTGRVLVQAAPWKGHHGICYVLLQRHAGCADHGAGLFKPPVAGYTFDERVASGTALTFGRRSAPLRIEHFPKLHVTFFLRTTRVPEFFTQVTLRDANGDVVARYRLKH